MPENYTHQDYVEEAQYMMDEDLNNREIRSLYVDNDGMSDESADQIMVEALRPEIDYVLGEGVELSELRASYLEDGSIKNADSLEKFYQPTVEEPTVEEPTVEEPTVEEPTVEEPLSGEVITPDDEKSQPLTWNRTPEEIKSRITYLEEGSYDMLNTMAGWATYATDLLPQPDAFKEATSLFRAHNEAKKKELAQFIVEGLTKHGYKDARIADGSEVIGEEEGVPIYADAGDTLISDGEGGTRVVDQEFVEDFKKGAWSTSLGLAGTIGGGYVAGLPGAFIGDMIMSGVGGGIDYIIEAGRMNKDIYASDVALRMFEEGTAGSIFGGIFEAALASPGVLFRAMKSVKDYFMRPNVKAARRHLSDFLGITEEGAKQLADNRELITGVVTEGETDLDKQIPALIDKLHEMVPAVSAAADTLVSKGRHKREELDALADGMLAAADKLPGDRDMTTLLRTSIKAYVEKEKAKYGEMVDYAVSGMADSGYRFDFNDLHIDIQLDEAAKLIFDPALQKFVKGKFDEMKMLGMPKIPEAVQEESAGLVDQYGRTLPSTVKAAEPVDPESIHPLRGIENLFQFKRAFRKLHDSLSDLSNEDSTVFWNIRNRIDSAITSALKKYHPKGSEVVEQFEKSNKSYTKMHKTIVTGVVKRLKAEQAGSVATVRDLMKQKVSSNTIYDDVMDVLPSKVRIKTEGEIAKLLTEAATVREGDFKYVDSPSLYKSLSNFNLSSKAGKEFTKSVGDLAQIFPTAHVLGPKLQKKGIGVGSDAVRLAGQPSPTSIAFQSSILNNILAVAPFTKAGGSKALMRIIARVVDNPTNVTAYKNFMSIVPEESKEVVLKDLKSYQKHFTEATNKVVKNVTRTAANVAGKTFGMHEAYQDRWDNRYKPEKGIPANVAEEFATPETINSIFGRVVPKSEYRTKRFMDAMNSRGFKKGWISNGKTHFFRPHLENLQNNSSQ